MMSWTRYRLGGPPYWLAFAAAALTACSPALDWREVRPDASGVVALFPCRPDTHERSLELAGQTVVFHLSVCEADGQVFALGHADMGDPAQVGPALMALQASVAAGVQSADQPPGRDADWRWPGATPQPAAGRWRLRGSLPDGRSTEIEVALAAHGTRVLRATVQGPSTPAAAGFLDALRVAE